MFRKMLRNKQELSKEECIEILKKEPRGVLAVLGDEGYPYAMPMNHWYCEEDGKIYFHGGPAGHKLDSLKRCEKVSFCVYDEGYKNEGEWWLNIKSVIVFGRAHIIEDHDRAIDISRRLSLKYVQDMDYIEYEVQKSGPATVCFELVPEHISGKRVTEK